MDCPYVCTWRWNSGSDSFSGYLWACTTADRSVTLLQNFYWKKHNSLIFYSKVCVAPLYLAASYEISHMSERGSQGWSFRVNLRVYVEWKWTFKGRFQGWIQAGWAALLIFKLQTLVNKEVFFCFSLKDVAGHTVSKWMYAFFVVVGVWIY